MANMAEPFTTMKDARIVVAVLIAVSCLSFVSSTFAQNDSPDPMLFQAIRRGDDTLLRSLLREGHSTSRTLEDGTTPLMMAALHGSGAGLVR